MLSFITPEFFDTLVLITIAIGVMWAALRIYRDFKLGPRWPEDLLPQSDPNTSDQVQPTQQEKLP